MADTAQQLKQAINFIKAGDRATAVKLITALIQVDKSNPDAWYLLATALTDRDKQIKALENALKINPRYSRAQVMLDKLRPAAARPASPVMPTRSAEPAPTSSNPFEEFEDTPFEDISSAFTEDSSAFAEASSAFAEASSAFAEASSVFVEYDDDDPFAETEDDLYSNLDPRLKQAVDLIQKGKESQAEQLAKSVLKENRSDADAWWVLANAVNDVENRKKSLQQVIKLRPDHTEARDWLKELEQEDDPDAFFAALDDGDGENPFGEDDGFADPFVDQVREAQKRPSKTSTPNPSFAFEFITFVLMLLVAGGAYYALQNLLGKPGSVIPEVLAVMSSEQTGSFDDMSGLDTFDSSGGFPNSFSPNCNPPPDLSQVEVVRIGTEDVIMRGELAQGGATLSGYKYELYAEGYRFNAFAGQSAVFLLSTTSPDFDPVLHVYRTSDRAVMGRVDAGYAGDLERLEITFDTAGEYVVSVESFGLTCGDYLISAS